MGDIEMNRARVAARSVLLNYFQASEKAMETGGALAYMDASDALLDAIADFVEVRRQQHAGMKSTHKGNHGAPAHDQMSFGSDGRHVCGPNCRTDR